MKILELYSGTKSITKYFDNTEHEVISLDILSKYNPTICCDILDWKYEDYPVNYFHIIWASPDCRVYSTLQYTNIGRKWNDREHLEQTRDENSKFILNTLDIIRYFQPEYYFVENPLHSAIWRYIPDDFKDDFVIVDYCYFGRPFKKPTKILTNRKLQNKRCSCKNHPMRIGISSQSKMKNAKTAVGDNSTLNERHAIPHGLLEYLFT